MSSASTATSPLIRCSGTLKRFDFIRQQGTVIVYGSTALSESMRVLLEDSSAVDDGKAIPYGMARFKGRDVRRSAQLRRLLQSDMQCEATQQCSHEVYRTAVDALRADLMVLGEGGFPPNTTNDENEDEEDASSPPPIVLLIHVPVIFYLRVFVDQQSLRNIVFATDICADDGKETPLEELASLHMRSELLSQYCNPRKCKGNREKEKEDSSRNSWEELGAPPNILRITDSRDLGVVRRPLTETEWERFIAALERSHDEVTAATELPEFSIDIRKTELGGMADIGRSDLVERWFSLIGRRDSRVNRCYMFECLIGNHLSTWQSLTHALSVTSTLRELILCNNNITPSLVEQLCLALRVNRTLTLLDLNNNETRNEGTTHVARLVELGCSEGPPLSKVSMWNNGIGEEGGLAWVQALTTSKTRIENLNIARGGASSNTVSVDTLKTIRQLIKQRIAQQAEALEGFDLF